MRPSISRRLTAVLFVLAAGCFNLQAHTGRTPDVRVREHVQQESKTVFLLWGLYRASDPKGPGWGQEAMAVSSLQLHSYMSFTDAVIGLVTLGVVVPWTVSAEAELLE